MSRFLAWPSAYQARSFRAAIQAISALSFGLSRPFSSELRIEATQVLPPLGKLPSKRTHSGSVPEGQPGGRTSLACASSTRESRDVLLRHAASAASTSARDSSAPRWAGAAQAIVVAFGSSGATRLRMALY